MRVGGVSADRRLSPTRPPTRPHQDAGAQGLASTKIGDDQARSSLGSAQVSEVGVR